MSCFLFGAAGATVGLLGSLLLLIVIGGAIEAWSPPDRNGSRW